MITRKTWNEFRESGLLWLINTILHAFGWAIVFGYDENNEPLVYPARVKFRGFPQNVNTDGYIKVSKFIKDNANDLLNEACE